MPGVGDDILNRKDGNKGLATYKYCDKVIFDFVDAMKAKFQDSLFIVTGDHSNLFGEFNNTSFLHRDYTMREIRNTVFYMQHPELSQTSLPASIGTHLSIMPTIIEAIAPKGFEYYAAVPSAFDEQPDVHVTPYQWITSDMVGDVHGDYGQYQTYTAEPCEYIRPIDNHVQDAEYWRSLSAWMMKFYANVQ